MANLASTPTQPYLGHITNSERWSKLDHRPDDVFICTPPKCGTTWTQAICAMLIFGRVDHGRQPGLISPWFDAEFTPIEESVALVQAQSHRRFIKTHTPLDGIPVHPSCTYLVVFRDPRDVFVSGINHRDNMADEELASNSFASGSNPFEEWLHGKRAEDSWDRQTLETYCHFFNTCWPHRSDPNIHIYHYADMKRDLRGAIVSMAKALKIESSEAFLGEMAEAATFESMKKKATQFAPQSGTGIWKAEDNFFARGVNQQWREVLGDADLAAFDARLAELVSPDDARWLLNGTG
jgi:aryl sulfotransferase